MRRSRFALFIGCLLVASVAPLLAQRPGAYLGDLTWPEAEARFKRSAIVIVPFGAGAKEHGPHLPLATDRIVLDYLLATAVDSFDVLVAPPILHGWFSAFREFPGTSIDDPEIFQKYVLEVAQSLVNHGAQRVLFLNTGIARATGLPLGVVARELHSKSHVPTLLVSWDDLETPKTDSLKQQRAGGHADEIETSIILVLQPALVHMDRAVTDYHGEGAARAPGYRPGDFSRDPNNPDYSTTGVFGDPRLATAEKGRRALAIMTEQWMKALRAFAVAPLMKAK